MTTKTKIEKVITEVLFVPWSDVEPNPFNPNKMDEEKRLGLKKLMKETTARVFFKENALRVTPWEIFYGGGRLSPKEEKKKHAPYVFIDGQHRWQNTQELDAEKVPGWDVIGVIVTEMTMEQARAVCYNTNYYRGETDPLKEAAMFNDDLKEGKTQEAIAKKYGHDAGYVSSLLSLLTLPKEVQMLFYTDSPDKMPLTKSHLLALTGLPDDEAKELAKDATNNGWSAKLVKERSDNIKSNIAKQKAKEEAESHFVLKECVICGKKGEITLDLKEMRCPDAYDHMGKLKIRSYEALNWKPLDTKESVLKKRITLDSGKAYTLENILAGKGRTKGSPIKRKLNWFKYEKTTTEIMPAINEYAYQLLLQNKSTMAINSMTIHANKIGAKNEGYSSYSISTTDNAIHIRLPGDKRNDRDLTISFEKKDWKRGPHKTRVNIQGADNEEQLKIVQQWLDKLMSGEAKPDDFPFHIFNVKSKKTKKEGDEEEEPEGSGGLVEDFGEGGEEPEPEEEEGEEPEDEQ